MQATIYHPYETQSFQAKRFLLWLAIGSMVMMFAGFTSAYIVKKADAGSWTQFQLPVQFYISTAIILISSVFMFRAGRAFKQGLLKKYKTYLLVTLLFGIGFLIAQVAGWVSLVGQGIVMKEEVSGAFLYVISGAHAIHVLGGVIILLVSYLKVSRKLRNPLYDLTLEISPDRKFRVELSAIYWHFVDILWIYLFLFLLYNHS